MTTIEMIEFFGWCSVINISLLIFSAIIVVVMRTYIAQLHSKLFNLNINDIKHDYFKYLAQYKIIIIVFNIVPYFALKLMS